MATKQNKRKSYPLVNWTDGLLVRKNHLMQLEDHFINQLCEYQSYHLNRTNYGFYLSEKENLFPVISALQSLLQVPSKSG